ncbi:MAG: hypothetical protein WCD31_03480, partial [Gillisia sp.]
VGLVSYYFFKMHIANEDKRRRFLLRQDNQKTALPIRLQAYERMALFLERISFGKILMRIKPAHLETKEYENLLIRTIEQEFEHNIAQQIYLTSECWNVIRTSKNAAINIIRKTAQSENCRSAGDLRETLLSNLMEQTDPTEAALGYLKKEVKNII